MKLDYICEIVPETTGGIIKELYPQKDYKNATTSKLHKHGKGSFCRFKIPTNLNKTGVYVIKVEEVIKYVGECENLSSRFNTGYGNISLRNCFVGGQATNCKINAFILKEIRKGHKVNLYFKESEDRFSLERELIVLHKPEWNSTAGKTIRRPRGINRVRAATSLKNGKYEPLKDYLMNCSNNIVELTYEEIERIIDNRQMMCLKKQLNLL